MRVVDMPDGLQSAEISAPRPASRQQQRLSKPALSRKAYHPVGLTLCQARTSFREAVWYEVLAICQSSAPACSSLREAASVRVHAPVKSSKAALFASVALA